MFVNLILFLGMHLLSCEHPKRIKNKYTGDYVTVACGECNTCKNMRAYRKTLQLNFEQIEHPYSFFVTLTYSDRFLPLLHADMIDYDFSDMSFEYFHHHRNELENISFLGSNDNICIPFIDFKFESEADWIYFRDRYHECGIPYASKSDIVKFNKRLNKYFYQNVSNKYQNFRYFIVSEYGSTTIRPHFHALFFVDDPNIADRFSEAVQFCWSKEFLGQRIEIGRTDIQFVESSANSYVAQYINKSAGLPSFYEKAEIKPFYLQSNYLGCPKVDRDKFGGNVYQYAKNLSEYFYLASPTTCARRKASSTEFSVCPIPKCIENRLFAKCLSFGKISNSLRIKLYSAVRRFNSRNFREFLKDSQFYLKYTVFKEKTDDSFYYFFLNQFKDLLDITKIEYYSAVEKLRKLYYLSKRILSQSFAFGISISAYVRQIELYWKNKELYLLKKFYEFQESYVLNNSSEDLALMYTDYLLSDKINYPVEVFAKDYDISDYNCMVLDSKYINENNKLSHFKNGYLDALVVSRNQKSLFNILKIYFYAKKCNEVIEAFPTSCSE